jgi:hypothetical protein
MLFLDCDHTDFDYGLLRLPDLEIGLAVGVTGQQGMLTPPSHLILPLVCPGVHVCPIFRICISYGFMRLISVRYIPLSFNTLLTLPIDILENIVICYDPDRFFRHFKHVSFKGHL